MATNSNNQFPGQWRDLNDLARVVKQLSSEKCLKDLGEIFEHINSLRATISSNEATIRSQEQTMQLKSDEFIRLQETHSQNIQGMFDTHVNAIKKRDEEKAAIQGAFATQDKELQDARAHSRNLEEKMQELQTMAANHISEKNQLKDDLAVAHNEIARLKKEVSEHKSKEKTREKDLKNEVEAHNALKSQAETYKQRCTYLEEQIKRSQCDLEVFQKYGPALKPDNANDVSKNFQNIWGQCHLAIFSCFKNDIADDVLRSTNNWHRLNDSHLVTYATPLPPTNSPAAKNMRFFVALAILAESLVRNIFTVSYLFGDVEDINSLTLAMADSDRDKEAYFRRILNSMPEGTAGRTMKDRVAQVLNDVINRIEPLLTAPQIEKLKNDLTEALNSTIRLWKSLQGRNSHFAVDTTVSSETKSAWKALTWNQKKSIFIGDKCHAPENVILILFPRVFMVERDGDRDLFPGMVLLRSETTAAHDEFNRLPPTSPSLTRAHTQRSTTGRRNTDIGPRTNGNFLDASGT